jgi:histidyl-tRNA synthetase
MHDLLPQEARRFSFLIEQGRALARQYGYKEVHTPILERAEVFSRPLGESSDVVGKEMYLLTDRGGETLALRPEGTAAIVRAFLSNGLTDVLPWKIFYAGPMFRYERPQKGRYRQFHQLGIESIGSATPWEDTESIALAYRYLISLHIEAILEINTLGDTPSRAAYKEALVTYFTKGRSSLSALSQRRLDQNPLRILDSKEPEDQELVRNAPLLKDFLTPEAQMFFETLCLGLQTLGIPYRHNPRLVRGLDYYTHTVFEFVPSTGSGTVLAGGRYDHLVTLMGGPAIPGFGWAAGIERLSLMASIEEKMECLIAVIAIGYEAEAHVYADLFRRQGRIVEVFCGKDLGKLLKKADKRGARYAVVFGEEEKRSGTILVKDLDRRTQEHVPLACLERFAADLL